MRLSSGRKLTREELDRKEKESKLTEVDKKTLRAAEEVEVYRRRIQEMEEAMEKMERINKNQVSRLLCCQQRVNVKLVSMKIHLR